MVQRSFAWWLARRWRQGRVILARWQTERPLKRRLALSSDRVLARALAAAGMERADLFTAFRGNAKHRKRMALMMAYFRIDRQQAVADFWAELREADSRCLACPKVRRCVHWLEWGARSDAARILCPNAGLFDRIALQQRGTAKECI